MNGLHGGISTNTYTLGNVRLEDQQVTQPSLTQVSNVVLQTGFSEVVGKSPRSPGDGPRKIQQSVPLSSGMIGHGGISKLSGSLSRGQLLDNKAYRTNDNRAPSPLL